MTRRWTTGFKSMLCPLLVSAPLLLSWMTKRSIWCLETTQKVRLVPLFWSATLTLDQPISSPETWKRRIMATQLHSIAGTSSRWKMRSSLDHSPWLLSPSAQVKCSYSVEPLQSASCLTLKVPPTERSQLRRLRHSWRLRHTLEW